MDTEGVELKSMKPPEHLDENDTVDNSTGDSPPPVPPHGTEISPKEIDIQLHEAAGKGDIQHVKQVFTRSSGQINVPDTQGYCPLHLAAKCGNRDVIEFLVQNGATINTKGSDEGVTPLHIAVINNNLDGAKCLIEKGADIGDHDNKGFTSLHYATTNGLHQLLQYLLDVEGVDSIIHSTDNAESTILHIAANENYPRLVELIIEKVMQGQGNTKDFVNHQNLHHLTALQVASLRGNMEAASVLVQREDVQTAFVNEEDNTTIDMKVMYPLHRAAANGDQSVLRYFIEKQVPIDLKDLTGFTPLMVAVCNGQEDVVNYLIEKGANIQLRDFDIKTCLHLAVEKKQIDILRILLEHCKEYLINAQDKKYRTPLHYAAKDGNVEALTVLLERASYIAVDNRGRSPLHFAADSGSLECVQLLKEAQLDIDLQANDTECSAPLSFAAKRGHTEVCKYLIENGAKIKNLCSADHHVFVGIFEQLIESTTINPEEEEEATRPQFKSVQREIDCLQTLLALYCKGKPNNPTLNRISSSFETLDRSKNNLTSESKKANDAWITKIIMSLKEEVCAVFDEHAQRNERQNKLVEMLQDDITKTNGENDKVIMNKLIQEIPDVATYALDKSIKSFEGTTLKRYYFGLLDIQHTDEKLTEPYFGPDTMNKYGRQQLLKHPVTLRLIKSKWSKLGLLLYLLGIVMYVIFLAFTTAMVVLDKQKEQNMTVVDGKSLYKPIVKSNALPWLTLVLVAIQILKELLRMYFMKTLYFKQLETLTELVTYVATLIFIVPFVQQYTNSDTSLSHELERLEEFKWQAGAVAILCAWVTFLLYLKKIPAIGRYVWMFEEVVKTALKVIIGLLFLLVAFAFSFFVLLKKQDQFRNVRRSFMKTIMWTFGEFEYDDIFLGETPLAHKEVTMIIFTVFLIIMPILTMNLLVGLAVGDIEEVRETAFARNFANQVKLLDAYNETYPKWLLRRLYKPFVDDDPNFRTIKEWLVECFIDLEKDKPDEKEMQAISLQHMVAKELREIEDTRAVSRQHSANNWRGSDNLIV